ncbi:hypothetical protein ACFQY4_33675 [Catellatospora bangladeshensis]|uniref:CASTOR/POLLUX-related putative ion channel n=1 Tax=Catellatospora bangladeshensis TaxID=310355 RepID=UPI0036242F7A
MVLDGDDIGARLIVQTARQSKLSVVYHDLFDFGGDEIYMTAEPALVGRPFAEALRAYQVCCPLGLLLADGKTVLNPPPGTVISPGDRIVLLARDDSMIKLATRRFPVDETAIVHAVRGPAAPRAPSSSAGTGAPPASSSSSTRTSPPARRSTSSSTGPTPARPSTGSRPGCAT